MLKNVVDMVYVCPVVFGKSGMGLKLLLHMNGCIRKGAHLVAFHLVISVEKRIVRRSLCLREEHDTP